MSRLKRLETFRRSGSSGLVWDDRFFFSDGDELNKDESGIGGRSEAFRELRTSRSTGFIGARWNAANPTIMMRHAHRL